MVCDMRMAVLALLAAVWLAPGPAAAATLVNGGFEMPFAAPALQGGQRFDTLQTGPGSSWNIWRELPGWTTGEGYGIEVQSNRTLRGIDALDGVHYVELDSRRNSSMFQDVLLGAGLWELRFGYSPRIGNAASNGIAYGLGGLGGGVVSGATPGTAVGRWTTVSQGFLVVDPGLYRLTFSAVGRSDSLGGLIDSVSLTSQRSPSQIPVPGGFVLLATAAGGLLAARGVARIRLRS